MYHVAFSIYCIHTVYATVSTGLWVCGAAIQSTSCSPAFCTAKDSLRLLFFTLMTSFLPLFEVEHIHTKEVTFLC